MTAWLSAAKLMIASAQLSGWDRRVEQLRCMYFELEKYGPAFNEPPAPRLLDDAASGLARESLEDVRAFARAHGSEILQRRGREAVDLVVSACARVAALGTSTPKHSVLCFELVRGSKGTAALERNGATYELGADEAADVADFGELPARPDAPELLRWLDRCVAVRRRPADWTPAHALALVLQAAAQGSAFSDKIIGSLDKLARAVQCDVPAAALLERGRAILEPTGNVRFVVLRAVEDQLMELVELPAPVRQTIVKIVDHVAQPVTAFRRAVVTASMTVLATSPKAVDRPRVLQ